MADVRPFRGVTYDASRVDLDAVLCPPYDVISAAQQAAYHERDPHNAVRIVLSRGDGDERYAAAARYLHSWLSDGVLRRDTQPAFYVHRQTFRAIGGGSAREMSRVGLIAAVRLEPWQSGAVKPHERTMPGPKEDRLKLLRATHADTEPIWVFHPDPSGEMRRLLDATVAGPPDITARFLPAADGAGGSDSAEVATHELWRVDDATAVAEIAATAGALQLYIADGHHRYETALYHAEEAGGGPDAVSRFKVMLLSPAEDPALLVLPTHRLVRPHAGYDVHSAFEELSGRGWSSASVAGLRELQSMMAKAAPSGKLGIGVYAQGRMGYMEGDALGPEIDALPTAVADLDVARLHAGILEPLLGIGATELSGGEHVAYVRDEMEVIARVDAGEFPIGLLLRPPTLEQIRAVADAGESMPQKSTYFWPKPASGLIMALQEPGERL